MRVNDHFSNDAKGNSYYNYYGYSKHEPVIGSYYHAKITELHSSRVTHTVFIYRGLHEKYAVDEQGRTYYRYIYEFSASFDRLEDAVAHMKKGKIS